MIISIELEPESIIMEHSLFVYLYFTTMITIIQAQQGLYRISLTFYSYSNPTNGTVADPQCCDRGFISQTCYVPCETMFSICLQTSSSGMNCSLTSIQESGIIIPPRGNISFNGTVGVLSNPVEFDLDTIPQDIQAFIKIEDDDEGPFDDDSIRNEIDLIDEVIVDIPATVGIVGKVRSYAGINGIASVTLQYQTSCIQDDYYGQNCDIFCSPQNDNINGYYDCDRITGDKICLEGYNGINCLGIENIKAVNKAKNTITSTQSQPLLYSSTIDIVSMDRVSTTDITANETTSAITTSTQSQPLLYSSTTDIISMDRVSTTDITANEITSALTTSTQSQPLLYSSTIGMEKVSTTSSSTNIVGSGNLTSNTWLLGYIAGIVGGVAITLLMVIVAIIFIICLCKRKQDDKTIRIPADIEIDNINRSHYYAVLIDPNSIQTAQTHTYKSLEMHTMDTKNNLYTKPDRSADMMDRSPHYNTVTKINATTTTTISNRTVVNEEYAYLYETPIDGIIQDESIARVKVDTTTPDYIEPIDCIIEN